MKHIKYNFSKSSTDYYFSGSISFLKEIAELKNSVFITDENVFGYHEKSFRNRDTIILKAGEEYKVQATVDSVIEQLIAMEADRKTTLIGVGGGVITDITGYVASVYMRGIKFGFVPTTVLAMVDASIGGKNGIDVGVYKNMVGIIRQPSFIFHDYKFLNTLPQAEWENGFAEIIKHSCIKDAAMFRQLEDGSFEKIRNSKNLFNGLIRRNALLKTKVVQRDEFEKGERRLLNFGHTLGHALENQYELSHGQAVAIGITYACHISEQFTGFKETSRVTDVLQQYGLPTYVSFNKQKVFNVLKMDKKKEQKEVNFIMLNKIGQGIIQPISLKRLEKIIADI